MTGLTSDPQFQTGRQEFINNGLAEWRNNEANKPKAKGGKTEGEKTEDVYKRLIKQQKSRLPCKARILNWRRLNTVSAGRTCFSDRSPEKDGIAECCAD